MGWFGGGKSTGSDPVESLDPKLREFLEKESPVKFTDEQKTHAQTSTPATAATATATTTATGEGGVVPSASRYPDGRYAHLWKTYRPLAEVEDASKNSSERLLDVLEGFKDRKEAIGKAALENCALEQEAWVRCLNEGDWGDKLQMCRQQVRKFERCYSMQSRFLRVLGYRIESRRPTIEEDRIQIHADGLYHKMLAHEAQVEEAKEKGLPSPGPFDPSRYVDSVESRYQSSMGVTQPLLRPSTTTTTTTSSPTSADDIRPEVWKRWNEIASKLPEDERPAELAALQADWKLKRDTMDRMENLFNQEDAERQKRRAEGKATFNDYFWGFVRPNDTPKSS